MMDKKLSPREREYDLQRFPINLVNGRWFYISEGRGVNGCSFHTNEGHAHCFPVTAILRAIQARGLLKRWDCKQQILKPRQEAR